MDPTEPNTLAVLPALVKRGTEVFSTYRLRFRPASPEAGPRAVL